MTPLKAIKAKCLDCCAYQPNEVKLCTCTDCALYPYRLGKNPNAPKRTLTEEQKQAVAERFKKAREEKLNGREKG